MSLMDALLLDEYVDKHDVWLTPRSDGLIGSGTATDAADVGFVDGTYLVGTADFSDPRLVLVLTPVPHGLVSNASVTIAGINTSGIAGRGPFFGTFTITVVSLYAYTYQLPSPTSGAPLPDAPPDASLLINDGAVRIFWPVARALVTNHGLSNYTVAQVGAISELTGTFLVLGVDDNKNSQFFYRLTQVPATSISAIAATFTTKISRFDNVVNATPENSILRLGASTLPFQTRGFSNAYTVPQGPVDSWLYTAGFRVKTAQRMVGSGPGATTLQLMYAADVYNQTTIFGRLGSASPVRSFEVSDLTLDANMAGQLKAVNRKAQGFGLAPVCVGAVALYGQDIRLRRLQAINFGTQCRPECFVLYTAGGGNLSAGTSRGNNVIEDCVLERPSESNTHEITAMWASSSSANEPLQLYVEANGYANVARRNYVDFRFSPDPVTGERVSNMFLTVQLGAPVNPPPGSDGTFTVLIRPDPTFGFHRTPGMSLQIAFVVYTKASTGKVLPHPYCNGSFRITAVSVDTQTPPEYTVTCQMLDVDYTSWSDGESAPNFANARVGTNFHGPIAYLGTGGVVEANSVYDCTYIEYTDTGTSRDVAIRDNYFSDVFVGFYQNFNPGYFGPLYIQNSPGGVVCPVPGDPTNRQVRVVCKNLAKHYLTANRGETVEVFGVLSGGLVSPVLNGNHVVTAVIDDHTFEYSIPAPTLAADVPPYGAPPSYLSFAQTRRVVSEWNLVDLYKRSQYAPQGPQGCISVLSSQTLPVFPGWVIRDNVFRHTGGLATDTTGLVALTPAVRMSGLNGALIESNLIDLEAPQSLQILGPFSGIHTFNNLTAAGKTTFGWDFGAVSNKPFDELVVAIEDALSLAF